MYLSPRADCTFHERELRLEIVSQPLDDLSASALDLLPRQDSLPGAPIEQEELPAGANEVRN